MPSLYHSFLTPSFGDLARAFYTRSSNIRSGKKSLLNRVLSLLVYNHFPSVEEVQVKRLKKRKVRREKIASWTYYRVSCFPLSNASKAYSPSLLPAFLLPVSQGCGGDNIIH